MKTRFKIILSLLVLSIMIRPQIIGQISPGELAEVHSALEGMSNCTHCHTLGSKVSDEKCLACHTEIKERIDAGKGYHSSAAVSGKACVVCHNDHHGRTFEIIRFEKDQFDHKLTGYELSGAHAKKACPECHKAEFISDQKIIKKKYSSYLGLGTACLSCHPDYHRNTLSSTCTHCHTYESFKPASKFDHKQSEFKLSGKHREVECAGCHKMETIDGMQVQKFKGIPFDNCTSCHADVHKNQFGQDCRQCHNEESFHQVKGMENFDHNKTGFPLLEKHQSVRCNLCHKTTFIAPVKHDRCSDCHADYHDSQFAKNGISPDCSACHNTKGFAFFAYTIEQHNLSEFPLDGAHLATPCFDCHRKTEKWSFRNIGIRCYECHKDVHEPYLDKKYYPESECSNCHSTSLWSNIGFDHGKTEFVLSGKHLNQTCRSCHFKKDENGNVIQRFSGLSGNCTTCHQDIHYRQFEMEGVSDCTRCHEFDNWKASKFDHNTARFVLDGKHINVACNKCHKTINDGGLTYAQYILNEFECESCHR